MLPNRLSHAILTAVCLFIAMGCSTNTKDAEEAEELRSRMEQNGAPDDLTKDDSEGGLPGSLLIPGLQFSLPEGWGKETPESRMRVAQLRLPAGGSGAEDGELIIFYFGESAGGDPEEALQRWTSQFIAKEGEDPLDAVERTEINAGGFKITTLEVTGEFQPSGMMTGQPGFIKTDWALLGAVIEGRNGPWFVRGTGPGAVMKKHRESFFGFLKSLEPR
ncbi:MAG: hypothetical protein KJ970_08205 [Candidatus Eisenbacteria bacterium]|uniref:Uncharacterized protein n=1 Tax=Eiseniibacteriota bacterium TaxID=2212470 RepID=A0A948W6Q8_UNCEI|nr:hypothetical protein [Candidatus Eisenbacteria bacterium]